MPPLRRCCIIGCMSNQGQNPLVQFYEFPKRSKAFHGFWKSACHESLARILPLKNPVICALHFHSDFNGEKDFYWIAVPSERLAVPSYLKILEENAMFAEIERGRKCAYIDAIIFEWMLRLKLYPDYCAKLSTDILKDMFESVKQLIAPDIFIIQNRWFDRFQKIYLRGFLTEMTNCKYKPVDSSLKLQDIARDLKHLFTPLDGKIDLLTLPVEYIDYMHLYGEFDETDGPTEFVYELGLPRHCKLLKEHLERMREKNEEKNFFIPGFINKSFLPGFDAFTKSVKDFAEFQKEEQDLYLEDYMDDQAEDEASHIFSDQKLLFSYSEALKFVMPLEHFLINEENHRGLLLFTKLIGVLKKGKRKENKYNFVDF